MIDMHSHCLPFIDDGADSLETSLKMLENAKINGADIVVSTPHCVLRKIDVNTFLKNRQKSYESVMEQISRNPEKYPVLMLGAEVFLGSDLSDAEYIEKLCYEGTKYILLETDSRISCSVLSEWIYNFTINGLKPVIAHIDRFDNREKLMYELNGIDVVYQINASRFLSVFSESKLKKILNNGTRFVVSSDMHNLDKRPFNLHLAMKKAHRFFNNEMCNDMFDNCARNIIFGK